MKKGLVRHRKENKVPRKPYINKVDSSSELSSSAISVFKMSPYLETGLPVLFDGITYVIFGKLSETRVRHLTKSLYGF